MPVPGRLRSTFRQARLIVFDKDGTLTHCDKAFGPWTEALVASLAQRGFLRDRGRCFQALDYDPVRQEFGKSSVVVRGTSDDDAHQRTFFRHNFTNL